MGLFGDRAAKQERKDGARAEAQRLSGLSVQELAVAVMAAFGPDGINAKPGHRQGAVEVVSWLVPGLPAADRGQVLGPVVEALGVLEHADLLTRRQFGPDGSSSTYRATRLGETALADGTVATQLGR